MIILKSKKKIVHLINSFSLAGAEKLAMEIARSTPKDKYDVQVWALANVNPTTEKSLREKLEKQNIKTYCFAKKPNVKSIKFLLSLINKLKKEQVEIIHTHCSSPDTYGRWAGIFSGVKMIIRTIHTVVIPKSKFNYRLFVDRLLNFFTDYNVVISKNVQQWSKDYLKIKPQKAPLIYNAVEIPRTIKKNDGMEGILLGVIGRLSEEKGHKYAIEAFKRYTEENPKVNIKMLFIGDGHLREELTELVHKLELDNKVIFLGLRKNVLPLMSSLDIVLIPSLLEGLPLVLLEAMSLGKAVVASKVGSIPEIIENEFNGLLVEPKSSDSIAFAVTRLLNDSNLLNKISDNARKTIKQKCSYQKMITGYLQLYSQCK